MNSMVAMRERERQREEGR